MGEGRYIQWIRRRLMIKLGSESNGIRCWYQQQQGIGLFLRWLWNTRGRGWNLIDDSKEIEFWNTMDGRWWWWIQWHCICFISGIGICFIDGRKYWKDDGVMNPAGIDGSSGGGGVVDNDGWMDGWWWWYDDNVAHLILIWSSSHLTYIHTLLRIYLIGPTG